MNKEEYTNFKKRYFDEVMSVIVYIHTLCPKNLLTVKTVRKILGTKANERTAINFYWRAIREFESQGYLQHIRNGYYRVIGITPQEIIKEREKRKDFILEKKQRESELREVDKLIEENLCYHCKKNKKSQIHKLVNIEQDPQVKYFCSLNCKLEYIFDIARKREEQETNIFELENKRGVVNA